MLNNELLVPDRFEGLRKRAPHQLNSIVEPVDDGLRRIDEIYRDMRAAGRGAFLVMRGESGAGKSTFLHTLGMFRDKVETHSIDPGTDVRSALSTVSSGKSNLVVIVLEEREALRDIPTHEIERDLHAINGFIRSQKGENCLVVWPCNTNDIQDRIVSQANQIGSDSLLGVGEPVFYFSGPKKEQFRRISEKTLAILNEGATLSDLGISDSDIEGLVNHSNTIGTLLGYVRKEILSKRNEVGKMLESREQCKLWVIVVAANEPDKDVAALTRGQYAAIDIERLMSATEANVVQDLKEYPEKLGILGAVLDAKIFHLPMLTSLAIAREFADDDLKKRMQDVGLSEKTTSSSNALERLKNSDFCKVLLDGTQGTMSPGAKPGSNTIQAFQKLVTIAQSSDTALNRAIGRALQQSNFIKDFKTEKDLGLGLKRRTDIYCELQQGGIIRIELMWRTKTSRAEIANYVLGKLYNYGRAIGFLE